MVAGAAAAVPKVFPKENPPVLAAGALVAAPNDNPPPVFVDPKVPDPNVKPDIVKELAKTLNVSR